MSDFRSWDELTVVEQLQSTFSDYYKSMYGFRPRHGSTEQWNSEAWLREQLDDLDDDAERVTNEEALREALAIATFEETITKSIAAGAADRETAIRWLMQESPDPADVGYFCYSNGLPYDYFSPKEAA